MEEIDKVLKIYELTLQEGRFYLEGHTKRVAFWAGFIGTILAGTTIGLLKAETHWEFFGLTTGPIVAIAIAFLGKKSAFRWYKRFIETITKIAKIEQKLGLTQENYSGLKVEEGYWTKEPLMPPRHIEFQKKEEFNTSSQFIDFLCTKGDYKNSWWFFTIIQFLSVFYVIFLVFIAYLVMTGQIQTKI